MKEVIVISAHAGAGKTILGQKYKNVLDLESSDFKWIYPDKIKNMPKEKRKSIKDRKLNPKWPQNYVDAIKSNMDKYDIILIMSHPPFLDYLDSINFEYILAYPTIESKEVYMERYQKRGNNKNWLEQIQVDFDLLIEQYENKAVQKIVLTGNETLEDALIQRKYKLIEK